MPVVYRFEMPDGLGIYRRATFKIAFEGIDLGSESDTKHPTPFYDAKLGPVWEALEYMEMSKPWFFGFSSEEQYLDWFSEEVRAKLAGNGVVLRKYEVPIGAFIDGETQAIFRKAEAKLLETLTEF